MELNHEIVEEIKRYLAQVAAHLRELPEDEQQDILEEVERHIHDALALRTASSPTLAELRAVLAEMDPPESYGRTEGLPAGLVEGDTAKAKPAPISPPVKRATKSFRVYGDKSALIRASVRAAIVHSLMPLGIVIFLTFSVPRLVEMFAEMAVDLPSLTKLVIESSRFLQHNWYILFFPAVLLLVADAAIYYFLRRRAGKIAGIAWYVWVLLIEFACGGFCYIALILPLNSLMNSMSG